MGTGPYAVMYYFKNVQPDYSYWDKLLLGNVKAIILRIVEWTQVVVKYLTGPSSLEYNLVIQQLGC